MKNVAPVIGLLLTAAGLVMLIPGRRLVSGSTLLAAWYWLAAALVSVLCANAVCLPACRLLPAWSSAVSCFAATMLLTPLVANLGARRPGCHAWQWFVVLPLVLVLQWPSVTQLAGSSGRDPVSLGVPAICGFVLVIMMSAGTYTGTTLATAVLFYLAGMLLLFAPVAGWVTPGAAPPALAALLIDIALLLALNTGSRLLRLLERATSRHERLNALWKIFQSGWGFAWSSRVQDRVNQFADRERWSVRLTPSGFRRSDDEPAKDLELELPANGFRWVLSRFFFEQRLGELSADPFGSGFDRGVTASGSPDAGDCRDVSRDA